MRISVMFNANGDNIIVPLGYNGLLRGAVYHLLTPLTAGLLHSDGFALRGRHFKLFTFSRLYGDFKRAGSSLIFSSPIHWYFSSPVKKVVKDMALGLLNSGMLTVGKTLLKINSLEYHGTPKFTNELEIRMLSPVTEYSTLYTISGEKKTYYYSPYEPEFSRLIQENAVKKASILSGRELKSLKLSIRPEGHLHETMITYNKSAIRGWMGRFILSGSKTLIKAVYECGLGSKNSFGMGMFEIVKQNGKEAASI